MKTKEIKTYTFDELSDTAKEKARDWYRQHALDYDWWEFMYEDAERIGLKITSFDLDRNRHAEGELTGTVLETIDAILKEHGENCETYKTAKRYEENARDIAKRLGSEEGASDDEIENLAHEFTLDLLEDYSVMLQNEYEYRLSDEAINEDISANEYEFTEEGKRSVTL